MNLSNEVIALLTAYAVGCPIGCGLKPIPNEVLDLLARAEALNSEDGHKRAALTALILASALAAAFEIEVEEAGARVCWLPASPDGFGGAAA